MCSTYLVHIGASTNNCCNYAKIPSNFNSYDHRTFKCFSLYYLTLVLLISETILASTLIKTEALVARLDFIYSFVQIRHVYLLFTVILLSPLLIANCSHLMICYCQLRNQKKKNQ